MSTRAAVAEKGWTLLIVVLRRLESGKEEVKSVPDAAVPPVKVRSRTVTGVLIQLPEGRAPVISKHTFPSPSPRLSELGWESDGWHLTARAARLMIACSSSSMVIFAGLTVYADAPRS